MSRMNRGRALGLGLVLIASASPAWAQAQNAHPGLDSIANAGVAESRLLDLSVSSVNDPAAAEMLFKEGSTIASVLEGLNEQGFHISYKEKHFLPSMTLLSLPKAERIDEVLREIVEPWNFRVYRSPLGHWIVTPTKRKKEPYVPDEKTRELLDRYKNRVQDKPDGRSSD